ncbi:lactonase family protein [Enterococcus ratti]|uniref:6-phosphogluconolactonase n=1 Tax=Enterococcus ratti TaxID=150033 RepID=A0A1L8WNM9_9ENTE|nr:lactonase family protein [Enterococcus ratti]OJG82639.1 6-phosphogluconolactonase [Enterococcus ratti]
MKEQLILGTYTRRVSEGIYTIELDTEKEEISGLKLVAKENSPTYLAKSKAKNLYNVTSIDGLGGIGAYDKNFHFLNAVTEAGAPLCYVAVDEARQLVYGANYHKGEINVYRILEDGGLEAADAVFHQERTGPHKNQDHSHVHYTDLTPDNRLVVCDLGTDLVYTYDVSDEGKLSLVSKFAVEPGAGPRHLVFHPINKTVAYLFGELDSTLRVLLYNKETGTFKECQKISTLPDTFQGENGGAAIRISKDGRFVYASNRGHNSIAAFAVCQKEYTLNRIQLIATQGDFPRDFALNSDNHYVVCANQNTDNLSLYYRHEDTGLLELRQKDIYAPECVCVYFN